MPNQPSFDLRIRPKLIVKRPKARVKRADEFKPLPLDNDQLQWAIGHNLPWVMSIVESGKAVQS